MIKKRFPFSRLSAPLITNVFIIDKTMFNGDGHCVKIIKYGHSFTHSTEIPKKSLQLMCESQWLKKKTCSKRVRIN